MRAARLDGAATCTQIELDEAVRAVREPGAPVWVDIVTEDTPETRALLTERMGLDELAVEDALSDRERPTLQEFDGMAFLVVPAAVRNGDGERYVEVGFFLNDHAMVTVSREAVPVLDAWFARWIARPGSLAKSPSFILHAVIDALVDDYFVVIDDMEDRVEDLGDTLFSGREGRLPEIVQLKRRLMKLRRAIAPVRDVLNGLLRRDLDVIPDESRRYFQDVLDHALRIGETVDALRDSLTSMVDIHLSNVSNNLNEVLKKMTVLSTVLMTMALVSGIYGMNFAHMPELDWRFGYPLALTAMVVMGFVLYRIFKQRRWL